MHVAIHYFLNCKLSHYLFMVHKPCSRKCCHPLKPNPLAKQIKSSIQHFPNQLIPQSQDGRALPTEMSHYKMSTGKAIGIIIMSRRGGIMQDWECVGQLQPGLLLSILLEIGVFHTLSDSNQCLNFAKIWSIQYSIQYCFSQDSIQNIIQFKKQPADSIQKIIQFNSQRDH